MFVDYFDNIYSDCKTNSVKEYDFEQTCNQLIVIKENKETTITLFYGLVTNINYYLPFFVGIFAVVPAIYMFHKKIKSEFFKNILIRQEYNKFFRKEYFSSLKASFIIPLGIMAVFIYAGFVTNWNFDVKGLCGLIKCNASIYRNPVGNNIMNIFPFTFFFFLNIWLHSIFCINLAYIIDKKSNNFFITCMGFFLTVIGVAIIMEILGGFVISEFAEELSKAILVGNIWAYDGIYNVMTMVLVQVLFALGTSLVVYKLYEKKEEVVIANE